MVARVDAFTGWDSVEGVSSALMSARDGVDALLRDRGMRRTSPDMTAEALLRGAAASAQLEGSKTDLEDLRSGSGDPLAIAAARLNAGLLALVPVVARSPLQAMARLHTLVAVGLTPDEALGRPRADTVVAGQLQGLSKALLAARESPGMAVAALAHAELLRIDPFVSYNGLVARAFERLVLVARGVDPASLLVPEAGHLALSREYRSAAAAYADGDPGGRARWLLYAAQAFTEGASSSPLATSGGRPTENS